MPGLRHYVLVRHRHNWILLARFVLVGLSGVLVNLLVLNLLRLVGPPYEDVWIDLPATEFNVRWYHLFTTGAFLAANMWNFQLNRSWAFRSAAHARSWLSEYLPFLSLGLTGLALNLALVTALIHPHSPVSLSESWFDDSSLLRSRLTVANLIAVAAVTPVSFVTNKLWTFRAVRVAHRTGTAR